VDQYGNEYVCPNYRLGSAVANIASRPSKNFPRLVSENEHNPISYGNRYNSAKEVLSKASTPLSIALERKTRATRKS
jgi:hypothetical protein